MTELNQKKKDLIAQWAFDTQPILGRFHLWLEDVDIKWTQGKPVKEFTDNISFLDGRIERMFAMTGAVTALGTQLYGRFGEGADLDKLGLNQVKKDADAISAYAMSESLWFLSRHLPENHALMVCLGEGLMPKAGETPEMGSNPQLGFGRVYARPEVASWMDQQILRLLNDKDYTWDLFYKDIKSSGITIWGAAIDTLENTSRFAKGKKTGPMTVLHIFNQPLSISKPYEGYIGNLLLPEEVVNSASDNSILINYSTPRELVLKAIELTYPGIKRENIHVWTLQGKSRVSRIGGLWDEWKKSNVHVVEDGWKLPNGQEVFTESGTYAPTYAIGSWQDDSGEIHLFLCDGYAASAEAMQAASLAPLLNIKAFLNVFTPSFKLPHDRERLLMTLNPDSPDLKDRLSELMETDVDTETVAYYQNMIKEGIDAGIPLKKISIKADDFFPEKKWDVLAVSGYMCPDPYSETQGVEKIKSDIYRVTVRITGLKGEKHLTFTLRLLESFKQSELVFKPLLNRFLSGEDFKNRPVKISDSGRIRNELQTLCAEALEFVGKEHIRIHFDRIPPGVIPVDSQKKLLDILEWYKSNHPLWFSWLEITSTYIDSL